MRIAAMDLGSNSFHLLVADAHPDGTFEPLLREKAVLRLADLVAATGSIGSGAADAAVETVRRFKVLSESVDADEVVACATSALREAEDSDEVVERIEATAGVRVRVISGREEARLIFSAIRASVAIDPAPALALDLGGGSLEMMVGDQSDLWWSTSVKLGAGRLTAELVSGDPPTGKERRRLAARVEEVLDSVAEPIAGQGPAVLIGSSGTLCALARAAASRRSPVQMVSVNQLRARRQDLLALHEELFGLTAAARQRLPGVDARRADLLPAGSTVLVAVMERFGFNELVVSDWALREGMVLDAIGHHSQADWSGDPGALRRESVLNLGRRCRFNEVHAVQVARLAMVLFDATAAMHKMGPGERELLELGALLHDVGEHVSVEGHDKHSAYLIEHGRLRGFSPEEVAVLVCLGRFHRGGQLKTGFPAFGGLTSRNRQSVTRMVALLRVADALDRSHAQLIDGVQARVLGDRVQLRVDAAGDIELERWGLRRKRELWEQAFGRQLEIVSAWPAPDYVAAVGER